MSPRFALHIKGRSRKNSLRVMFGVAPFLFASRSSAQGSTPRSASTQATVTILPANMAHVIPADSARQARVACDGTTADHEQRCALAVTKVQPTDVKANRVETIELLLP